MTAQEARDLMYNNWPTAKQVDKALTDIYYCIEIAAKDNWGETQYDIWYYISEMVVDELIKQGYLVEKLPLDGLKQTIKISWNV